MDALTDPDEERRRKRLGALNVFNMPKVKVAGPRVRREPEAPVAEAATQEAFGQQHYTGVDRYGRLVDHEGQLITHLNPL